VTSGVPQGSHLGPLLFGIFINNLPQVVLSSHVMMYANDVKLCLPLTNPNSRALLQADLNNLHSWCIQNLLFLKNSKCNFMSFYRKNLFLTRYFIGSTDLERINSFIDHGVLFNHNLNFTDDITALITLVKKRGFLLLSNDCQRNLRTPIPRNTFTFPWFVQSLNTAHVFGHLNMLSIRTFSNRYRNSSFCLHYED